MFTKFVIGIGHASFKMAIWPNGQVELGEIQQASWPSGYCIDVIYRKLPSFSLKAIWPLSHCNGHEAAWLFWYLLARWPFGQMASAPLYVLRKGEMRSEIV